MSPHYLVKCRTRSPDRSYTVSQKKMDSFENSRLLCCIATWILDKNTRLILAGHISRLMNGMSHGTVAWPCHERDVLVHCLAGRRTHLVGIIWQYATSPPHTDGSIVFARLRQYAPATNPWFFGTQQCVLQSPPPAVCQCASSCQSWWRSVEPLARHGYLTVFGRPFVKRFALCYRSVVRPVCLSCL